MSWPSPQDYNEAVQTPHLSFDDPELKSGMPETNRLGLPRAITGAFASVYRIHCQNHDWAVRCFLRDIPDQDSRYFHISKYVMSDDLPCTVGFDYLPRGIKVQGAWYPILKMEWVEGDSLDQFVRKKVNEPAAIAALLSSFNAMIYALHEAGIAHGDLQHGNIMVVGDDLRLVDYDGMYVPGLTGWLSNELGHRNYQHPSRSGHDFGPALDNFSIRVIQTSLLSLSLDPTLWEKTSAGDECLLFRHSDYRQPLLSRAFYLLEQHELESIRSCAAQLRHTLPFAPTAVPFIDVIVDTPSQLPDLDSLPELAPDNTQTPPASAHPEGSGGDSLVSSAGHMPFQDIQVPEKNKRAYAFERQNGTSALPAADSTAALSAASVFCHQGDKQLEDGNFEQALRYFQKAIHLDPDCAEAFCGLGLSNTGLKEFPLSLSNFSAAIRLKPHFSLAYAGRGLALNGLRQFVKAILDFNFAIEIDPGSSKALCGRGLAQAELKQYSAALADLEAAIRATPSDAETYCSHGVVVQAMGRHEQAIRDFDMALSLNSHLAQALYFRGRSAIELGRFQGALADFQAAIQLRPGYAEAHFGIGAVRNSLCEYELAIKAFETGLACAENRPESGWWGLGLSFYGLKQYARAGSFFERATRRGGLQARDIDEAKVLSARGFSCLEMSDYGRSVEYFDKAIGLDSTIYEAYLGRGIALFTQGFNSQAFSDLDTFICRERSAESLSWHGLCALRLNKLASAAVDFQESLALDPDCRLAYLGNGWLQLHLGNYAAALENFDNCPALGAGNGQAALGRMLAEGFQQLEQGKTKQALRFFQQLNEGQEALVNLGLGLAYLQLRKFKEAEKEFNKALSLNPGATGARLALARLYMERQEYSHARDCLNEILSLHPELHEAYKMRSRVWEKLGRKDLSNSDRQRADDAGSTSARAELPGGSA